MSHGLRSYLRLVYQCGGISCVYLLAAACAGGPLTNLVATSTSETQ